MHRSDLSKAFRAAFPVTLPVMAGYLVLGFGFGLLMQSKGYNVIWAVVMGIVIFGGSMQYVAVDLMATGAGLITTAIMTLLIHARQLFYSLSMLTHYRDVGKIKPYLIFTLSDETFSLVSSGKVPDGLSRSAWFFAVSLLDQCYWIAGSALGALFGQVVHINTLGVDFSMTALFLVILTDRLLNPESRFPAIIGLFVTLISLILFGPERFLIPAMIGISAVLLVLRPILERRLSCP